jgi:hypothetical protein
MSGKSSAASRSPRLRASKAALRTFPAPLEATRSLHHWRDSMEILNGIHKNLQGLTPEPIQASNTGAGAAAETESVTGLNPSLRWPGVGGDLMRANQPEGPAIRAQRGSE